MDVIDISIMMPLAKGKLYIVGDLLRQIRYRNISTRMFHIEKRKSRSSHYLCKVFTSVPCISLKTGVKQSTLANYKTVVNTLNKTEFAFRHVDQVKLSDAKMFLISLQRNGLEYSSIHNIRGVIRPAFQMAVDDDMILKNPFDFEMGSVLINDSNKREALSPQDQKRFLEFVKNDKHYSRYYDAFFISV